MDNSLHYSGNAVDIRKWDIAGRKFLEFSNSALGKAWKLANKIQVIEESDHIHVERDVKAYGGG